MAEDDEVRGGSLTAVGGVGEVSVPPGVRQSIGEGAGGASDKLRTTMETMDIGEEVTDKKKSKEMDKDDAKAEGRGLEGPCWHWKPQGY